MSIATAIWAEQSPDETALCDERCVLTWRQVDATLNRATNALLACGLKPGERAAVFAENSAETVLAHLAGISAGISTVPINFHLTAAELAYILEDSRAGVLFVGPETAAVGLEAARVAGVRAVVGWRCDPDAALTPWSEFVATG